MVQQGIQTISQCKLQCVTTPACKGIEFEGVGGTCKLLTRPDSWSGRGREKEREMVDIYLLLVLVGS